ncbi:MAG: 1-acyl-sn-glycerol-3-phosphate acyltransferase, partial [Chloroflexota bacterium]
MPLVHHALLTTGHRQMLRRMVTANMVGPEFTGIFAWLGVLALGLYPLDQQRGRDASLRRAVRTVRASGGSLLIFPQGTHATTAAELANDPSVRFRAGATHLAAALNLTVVPFGLAGTENVIPPSVVGFDGVTIAGLPVSIKRRPLAIAFGEPLTLAAGESPQAFTERLQIACYALTREAEWAIQGGAASRPGLPSARAS